VAEVIITVAIDASMNGQLVGTSMDVDGKETRDSRVLARRPPSPHPMVRAQSEPFQPPKQHTVGYVYSADMLLHVSLHGHPEQPDRISRILEAIQGANLLSKMKQIPIRPVYRNEALLVHTQEHWDKVLAIQSECAGQAFQLALSFNLFLQSAAPLTMRVSSPFSHDHTRHY
jgi:histone deacetylase 6